MVLKTYIIRQSKINEAYRVKHHMDSLLYNINNLKNNTKEINIKLDFMDLRRKSGMEGGGERYKSEDTMYIYQFAKIIYIYNYYILQTYMNRNKFTKEYQMVKVLWDKEWSFIQNFKILLPHDQAIILLSIYP